MRRAGLLVPALLSADPAIWPKRLPAGETWQGVAFTHPQQVPEAVSRALAARCPVYAGPRGIRELARTVEVLYCQDVPDWARRLPRRHHCRVVLLAPSGKIFPAARGTACLPGLWQREEPPLWGTAVSAWGDTLVSAGTAREVMQRTGAASLGMVYYGRYPEIRDFLAAQPWCREAVWVEPGDIDAFWRVMVLWTQGAGRRDWLPEMLRGTGIAPETVCATHISLDLNGEQPCCLWKPRLPADAWRAARERLAGLPSDTYLLHPWSFQSAQREHHWPHWPALVTRLLEETGATFLLTGTGYDPESFGHHPRLVNLVGQTPRMIEVLALASRCRGVVSTCNSVACWAAARGDRAFVASNCGIPLERNLFARWIRQASVTWCWHGESLETVWGKAEVWLGNGR